jgi:hypothetical protein
LPFPRAEHEPFAKFVKLPVVTDTVPALNVSAGHLPVSVATTASNSVGTPDSAGDEPPLPVTITDVAQESTCCCASVAVHVTAVLPIGNADPDVGWQLAITGATPPVTVGLRVTFTGLPLCEMTGAMSGQEIASGAAMIAGGGAAVTVTLELHEAFACLASNAVQDRAVVPTGNSDPEAGAQLDDTGAVPPDAVGENVTATGLPSDDVADGAGHMMASGTTGATGGL